MATTIKHGATRTTPPVRIGMGLPVVLGILMLLGIVGWVLQFTQGMSALGVGQGIVWGLYIDVFFFLAGLSGGLVILAALADLKVIPALKQHRNSLLIGALAGYIASGIMILLDIGQPLRVLNMIFSANLTSPFVWDFFSLALSVIVSAVYLFYANKSKLLPVIAAIVAGLVISVEGWILSMSAGSPLWHGGITPATFLVEAFISASALTLILKEEGDVTRWLRRAMLVLLPVLVVLNIFEFASIGYVGHPEAQAALQLMMFNPIFWAIQLLGIVLPFGLLAWGGTNKTVSITSGILLLLAVFGTKYMLLVTGQALPYMQAPASYVPTLVEVDAVVGILALAGLLFVAGVRWLAPKAAA